MPIKYPFSFETGDLVFSRINNFIFNKVAVASLCWSNHVAIIVGYENGDYIVAESIVPFSRKITLSKYIANSYHGYYAVRRLKQGLTDQDKQKLIQQVDRHMGVLYGLGFKLDSDLEFCSKLVYEVYNDALGIKIGNVETFEQLLKTNPKTDLGFWRFWFLGQIPWQRKTITPASQWNSPLFETVFVSDSALLD